MNSTPSTGLNLPATLQLAKAPNHHPDTRELGIGQLQYQVYRTMIKTMQKPFLPSARVISMDYLGDFSSTKNPAFYAAEQLGFD